MKSNIKAELILIGLLSFSSLTVIAQDDSIPPPPLPKIPELNNHSESVTYYYYTSASIKTNYNKEFELEGSKIINGDSTVFEFKKVKISGSSHVYKSLIFQIPNDLIKFEFKNDELPKLNCIIDIACHCNWWEMRDFNVSEGIIKGKKLDNGNWLIIADVNNGYPSESENYFRIAIEEEFVMTTLNE